MLPIRILHVEDDEDDAFFFFRALKSVQPGIALDRMANGERAINFLRKLAEEEKSGALAVPDLMVLDLKLPGLSGFEVLSWTRGQEAFKTLPIVVLSGSSLAQDKRKASELGASYFIVKHSEYDEIVKQILHFFDTNAESTRCAGQDAIQPPSQAR
jgi:DNA-binding response OmpR family regulator